MKALAIGSVEWFEAARWRCIDHLRALLSIRIAHDSAAAILRDWNSAQSITKAALHAACVIAYARPFTLAITKHGKVIYPTKTLKRTVGFDAELHTHILNLRNRLIAHSDYDVFPSTMYLQIIGDERLPVSLGLNVKGMIGIQEHALAARYEKHLSVCAGSIETALNQECNELALQSRLHPAEFSRGQNIPEVAQVFKATSEEADIPPPIGPASEVANPSFPEALSGYNYITLTHQIALIADGKYTVHTNGVSSEIIFSVQKKA